MKIMIAATTAAAEAVVTVPDGQSVTIGQDGLSGVEKITVYFLLYDTPVLISPEIALTTSTNLVNLTGPCTYKIVKPVTTNPTQVGYAE